MSELPKDIWTSLIFPSLTPPQVTQQSKDTTAEFERRKPLLHRLAQENNMSVQELIRTILIDALEKLERDKKKE